uniref:Repulsive guidance molecule A n=1 Tax=Phallusia mammillata TaxID=59560 RepID=A0A6F9DR07_9ASCI|nr:repulsive guidance molecule A [Phallusia mammillata]
MRAGPTEAGSTHFSISNLFVLFLIVASLILSVDACQRNCRFQHCVSKYNRFQRRLRFPSHETAKNPGPTFVRHCRSIKRYMRCLKDTQKRCIGCLPFHGMEQISRRTFDKDCYNIHEARSTTPTSLPTTLFYNSTTSAPAVTKTTRRTPTPETAPVAQEGSACTYSGKPKYRHCGMFGDPHLRTFDDSFFTCKVEGTWPLINNDYMVVMATNVPVKEGSSATVTTKITVLIKEAGKCAGRRHYSATSKSLPRAFTDGSVSTGSVNIKEVRAGKHVEIEAKFIDTTVIIRRVGRFLTFAIQMPEEFVHGIGSQTQLCVVGCTTSEKISPSQHLETITDGKKEPETTPSEVNELETGLELLAPPDKTVKGTERMFTELEARKKCKEIILAVTGTVQYPILDGGASIGGDASKNRASFSSLIPDSTSGKQGTRRARDEDHEMQRRRRGRRKKSRRQTRSSEGGHTTPCANKDAVSSNFYFDSCVFDLVTTGDVNFTLAARAALEDVRRMHALRGNAPGVSLEVVKLWEPTDPNSRRDCPTEITPTPSGTGSGARVSVTSTMLALCVAFSLLVNLASFQQSRETMTSRARRTHQQTGFRTIPAT